MISQKNNPSNSVILNLFQNQSKNILPISPSTPGHTLLLRNSPSSTMERAGVRLAFTLVELIVVIVILAILATISFLSFSSYSLKSRDSVRLADMNNISKGLLLYYTKSGTYPIPDNSITITASGTNIGYQGYAGLKTLGIINLSNGGKDPLDNIYYTYNSNTNQNKYQLLGYLEDSTNSALSYIENGDLSKGGNGNINYFNGTNIFNRFLLSQEGQLFFSDKVYADSSDYSKRFYYTKGDSLGVIVNSGTNTPIQYNNTNSGFELTTATGTNYSVYIDKNTTIQSTGSMIGGLAGFYTVTQANSRYPGCDTNDIKLSNGQIWAACNVGATQAWNNQVTIQNCGGSGVDCDSNIRYTLGSYFQWGRNTDITATTVSAGPVASETNTNFYTGSATLYDWISPQNDNLWGGSGTTATGGTYYTQGQPSSMQGPCANGYHIPTQLEWWNSISNINPNLIKNSSWQNEKSVNILLKIPIAGYRNYADGTYLGQNSFAYYWSSTVNYPGYSECGIYIGYRQLKAQTTDVRSQGFSVRCIKN